jgi:hypothetical protein
LSFAEEMIGPLAAIVTTVFYLLALYLLVLPNTPENLFASIYSESLIKTTHQYLLLLVGFDTFIYRKYYDTPPILVGHHYAVAGVDEVMGEFEQLKLDDPAGEGDLYELGEAKKTTVLWLKECIVLPNWTPRSPARHPSPPPCQPSPPSPRQPSPVSPPHQPSPEYQPSPASELSLPPPPTEARTQKQKRTIAAPSMSRNRSPIRRQEPLPRVPKVPPKRPYDYTPEKNAAKVQEKSKNFFENLKRKKTEQSAE